MEGLPGSLEQPPAQSRAGSNASCPGLCPTDFSKSPIMEIPCLWVTTPLLYHSWIPRDNSETTAGRLESNQQEAKKWIKGWKDCRALVSQEGFWEWLALTSSLKAFISQITEVKSCSTWLPAALNGTPRTPKGHQCFTCFYKDTKCPCVTRWLEII